MFPLSIAGLDRAVSAFRRPMSAVTAVVSGTDATSVTQGPSPVVS
jgi:hypothetical protein